MLGQLRQCLLIQTWEASAPMVSTAQRVATTSHSVMEALIVLRQVSLHHQETAPKVGTAFSFSSLLFLLLFELGNTLSLSTLMFLLLK